MIQENWPALEKLIRFIYAFQCARRLKWILHRMDIPTARRKTSELHHLMWLRRNIHINNQDHVNFQEANDLIKRLLWDSTYMELKKIESAVYEIVDQT